MIDLTLAICMYNAEKYIEETLQCLMAQTMQDFHLMIINDCSTDGSVARVEAFFAEHPRQFELVNLPVNGGLCAGRRYVEEHANTKYLLFVDADDCPYPEMVEKIYQKITSDEDLMAVGCYLEYINLNSKKTGGGIFLGETTKDGFYQKAAKEKLIFMASTSMYDRELALSVGGHNITGFPAGKPRYQDLCEDLDLWTRMSDLYKDGKAIVVIPEILYQYRKGDGMSLGSFGMTLRMRHIKNNLKRRRRGERELTFIEFRDQLSDNELRKIENDSKAADCLRNSFFYVKKGRIFTALGLLFKSIYYNPKYLLDKIKHNILRMK
ncbi:MAG: glycosyltransferase family 2 protein [Candidatus Cryptobacteroides sp.]